MVINNLYTICFNREEVFHMVRTVPERDSNGSRDTTGDNVKTRTLPKTKDWVTQSCFPQWSSQS